MMIFTGNRVKMFVIAVVLILVGLAVVYYVSSPTPERKPEIKEKPYAYYMIIDESTGKTLTYVSTVAVSVGDEYMDADGQWYQVVRVEGNRAYARRFAKPR